MITNNKQSLFNRIKIPFLSFLFIGLFTEAYYSLNNATGRLWGMNYNLAKTILVVILGFVAYLLLMLFTQKIEIEETDKTRIAFMTVYLVLALAVVIFLLVCYESECSVAWFGEDFEMMFSRDMYSHIPFLLIITAFSVVLAFIASLANKKAPWLFRKIFAIALAVFGGVLSYAPNAFKNQAWWFYHVHAYTTSIVNVMNGVPFNDTTNGIYGHYGIILYPLVKVLGDDFFGVMRAIAVVSGISFLLAFIILDKLIENDVIYVLSSIACLGTVVNYFCKGFLFQEFPARVFAPILTLAYLIIINRSKKTLYYITGILVGTLSVLFNTETGICCSLTIAAVWMLENWNWKARDVIVSTLKAIAAVAVSFLIAYAIVLLYNCLHNGEIISIGTFIYPFGNSSFDVQSIIRVNYPSELSWHTFRAIVFCGFAFEAIRRLLFKFDEDKKRIVSEMAIGLNGMSILLLYINHCSPAYLAPSHMHLVILLAIMAEKILQGWSICGFFKTDSLRFGESLLALIAFFVMANLALDCIATVPKSVANRKESVWETDSLREEYAYLESILPTDVPALGFAIPEIYYQLGIDPKIYTSDWADKTPGCFEEAERAFEHYDRVIMSGETAVDKEVVPLWEKNNFEETTSVDFQWFRLVLMSKKAD